METTSDYSNLFKGEIPLEGLKIIDELLSWSLKKDHAVFNPMIDTDPLITYGRYKGQLPGYSMEDSALFRDILLQWHLRHAKCYWTSVEEGTKEFIQGTIMASQIVQHKVSGDPEPFYSLALAYLNIVRALLVALNQIFQALSKFL